MFLSASRKNYYKILRSYRDRSGKVRTETVRYVGKLTFAEREKLKILLLEVKTKGELTAAIKQAKNTSLKVVETQTAASPGSLKNKVKLVEVRDSVFKKVIDKDWLKKAYLKDGLGVGHIAQVLGVGEDRVREHLTELGYDGQKRVEIARFRNERTHLAFGWHVINGQKIKDPTEWEVIEQMIRWRNVDELTFDAIADKLTKMGVAGKLGVVTWDRGSVRRVIMRNEKK